MILDYNIREIDNKKKTLDKLELEKHDNNFDYVNYFKLIYEFHITVIINNISLRYELDEFIELSYDIKNDFNIFSVFDSLLEEIHKEIPSNEYCKIFELNTLVLSDENIPNSIKVIIYKNELNFKNGIIDNLNSLLFDSSIFYDIIVTRYNFIKAIIKDQDYIKNKLLYSFNNDAVNHLFIYITYLIKYFIKSNNYSEIYKLIYNEINSIDSLSNYISTQIINNYLYNLIYKLISYNHLFQIETPTSIEENYSNYINRLSLEQQKEIKYAVNFSPKNYDIRQLKQVFGETNFSVINKIKNIKTEIFFIIPFEIDKSKINQIISDEFTIEFHEIKNLYDDPIFKILDNSSMQPIAGDPSFPCHFLTDAYPSLNKSTLVIFNFDRYINPEYLDEDNDYWEILSGSYANNYKRFVYDILFGIMKTNLNIVPLKINRVDFCPTKISNILINYYDSDDNIISTSIDILTNKNTFNKFKDRFHEKLNSLNIEKSSIKKMRELILNSEINNDKDLMFFSKAIIEIVIKKSIKSKGIYKLLWNNEEKPFKEPEAQPLLYSLLDTFFEIKGIQLSKEPELANGKLDFNCSYTNKRGDIVRTCIEVKNAHHDKLIDGLITQLPLYMEASNTESGIFLVLWYKGNNFNFPKYETIEELEKTLLSKIPQNKNIEIIIIDCSKQTAPSKIKSKKKTNQQRERLT